ncbi:AAA family ATPase [Fictibacillus phosphorivorans]|uniref:AAA family ATPase n=1 Tax=Fictibacillus phosphorivorans TaxID=1221500 RepID=UPI00204044D6|nr:AAA family ATPase [Fictibacillus phosphorivorans]MCM3719811.1 AAA family ATPase [Fictibacillus phosphorivorans]MCM3777518.1 AAA family ATPase [Fictibacillus phosphorivorans]
MLQERKLLIVSDNSELSDQIHFISEQFIKVETVNSHEVLKELDRLAPDIIIIIKTDDSTVELVQSIHAENSSPILLLTESQDFILLRDVIRAGAIDYFVIPDEISLFEKRLQAIIKRLETNETDVKEGYNASFKRGRGQVISFYSAKGGSGKTFVATSFAQTLKLESTAQVLLIDLNLQFGGIETYLSIESTRSLIDLNPVIEELNESHIQNVSEKESHSKLEILLSPKDAEIAESVTQGFVSKLIRACRRSYDFIILDLPSYVDDKTYIALEESDVINYILNLDTPSLRAFKDAEVLFQRLGIDVNERLQIIVNKTGKENEVTLKDIKDIVTVPVVTDIRYDKKTVQPMINQGLPLQKKPNEKKLPHPAKDIRKWVLSKLS